MNKKNVARYTVAGTTSLVYAATVLGAYKELGTDPAPNDKVKLKKVVVGAVVMTGLTWLAATL